MGRPRKHRKERRSLPEVLASELPVEVNMLEFTSTVEGLRSEQARIKSWLESRVPGGGADLLGPVMAHTGFDQAQWFAQVLGKPKIEPFRTTAPRECYGCGEVVDGRLFPDTLLDPEHPERSLCGGCVGQAPQ